MKPGDDFENEVFRKLAQKLRSGDLGLNSASCLIFQKKKYPSRDRKASIETDISIEIYAMNSVDPNIIWIWECKDYGKPIPVRIVEEFHSVLAQIGSDKTKGTIATRNGFQRSAIEYARACGIGLLRDISTFTLVAPLGGLPVDQFKSVVNIDGWLDVMSEELPSEGWIWRSFSNEYVGLDCFAKPTFGSELSAFANEHLQKWLTSKPL
jgi:hypothetical protein